VNTDESEGERRIVLERREPPRDHGDERAVGGGWRSGIEVHPLVAVGDRKLDRRGGGQVELLDLVLDLLLGYVLGSGRFTLNFGWCRRSRARVASTITAT